MVLGIIIGFVIGFLFCMLLQGGVRERDWEAENEEQAEYLQRWRKKRGLDS